MPALFPNLPEVLYMDQLTEAVRSLTNEAQFPSQNFNFLFPEKRIKGKTASWDTIVGNRDTFEYISDGGAALGYTAETYAHNDVRMPLLAYFFGLEADHLTGLRKPGTADEELGLDFVTEKLEEMRIRVDRTNEANIWKALSDTFSIMVDGSSTTITDYKTSTMTPANAAAFSSATWATTSNDVISGFELLKLLLIDNPGFSPSHAFFNNTVGRYMKTNDDVMALIRSTKFAEDIVQTNFEQFHFGGVTCSVIDQRYTDAVDDSTKRYIADDKLIMLSNEPGWSQTMVGEVTILNNKGNIGTVNGVASYSRIIEEPVGAVVHIVDRRLPVVKVADATVYADVT